MANPSWITSENIKFNGTLDNAAVLATVTNVRSAILWDTLSPDDKTILTTFVDNHGGALPLAGPTSGFQTIDFSKTVVGGHATGLNNVATATAGKAIINVGGNKTGVTASGLSASAGTKGYQFANFGASLTTGTVTNLVPTSGYQSATFSAAKTGASATGLAADTAGYQIVNVGGAKVGGDSTGLANDTTAYTASISIDGTPNVVSVVGSAAQTITTLISEINADLTGAVAALVGGNIKITSSSTGVASIIAITDTDLFSSLTGYVAILTAVDGTTHTYTTTITINGVAKQISVVGNAAQTFTDLVAEINTDLAASATAAVVNGGIKVTSATTTPTSTVLMITGTLFPALTNFSAITAAVPGTGSTTALTATIIVDGVTKNISVLPTAITTFADVITEINTDLGVTATASITGGNIKITSATYGVHSTVVITPGTLFAALPSFIDTLPTQPGGSSARTYSATVIVDNVIKTVSFTGALGDTFQHVIDEINTDLGVSASADITDGNIVITSATTGLTSSVRIDDNGFLFNRLTGYVGISYTASTAPVNYLATITVDGVAKPISVKGSAAQTFTNLITEINTDLAAAATAAIVDGNIVVTSATTGTTSTVSILDKTLFKAVGARGLKSSVSGITDLLDAFAEKTFNGNALTQHFKIINVGLKPHVPTTPAILPKTPQFTYYATTGGWKYLADDSIVNA